jgi:hypothetical protein
MSIAGHSQDFEVLLMDSGNRNVKRATSQVEHEHVLLPLLFEVDTKGNRCCGRLINDFQNIEASDSASIFCCLPLAIIEIGRHCYHTFADFASTELLGKEPAFVQDHG